MKTALILKRIADGVNQKTKFNDLSLQSIATVCEKAANEGKYSVGITEKLPFSPLTVELIRNMGFTVTQNSTSITIKWS